MTVVRSTSELVPVLLLEPHSAWQAVRVATRAEAMGLLGPGVRRDRMVDVIGTAFDALDRAGIARREIASLDRAEPGELAVIVGRVSDALEASPHPDTEWGAVARRLGDELLARLTSVSPSSLARYAEEVWRRSNLADDEDNARRLFTQLISVAVGGTATNLLKILPEAATDRILTRERIGQAQDILATEPAAAASLRHGVKPMRARQLPAGGVILDAILERYGTDRVRVSDAGIREGVILAVEHAGRSWRDRLPELAHGWRA